MYSQSKYNDFPSHSHPGACSPLSAPQPLPEFRSVPHQVRPTRCIVGNGKRHAHTRYSSSSLCSYFCSRPVGTSFYTLARDYIHRAPKLRKLTCVSMYESKIRRHPAKSLFRACATCMAMQKSAVLHSMLLERHSAPRTQANSL